MISLLIFGCMIYACDSLVMCYHWHGELFGLTVLLSFSFQFLDNHGVVGFPLVFLIGSQVPYGCGLEQTLSKPSNNLG